MLIIGVDPHKDRHQAVAVDKTGHQISARVCDAVRDGFGELLSWARGPEDQDRVWVIEDCRHVSGPLERFLIDHGESVARLAPHLMAEARNRVGRRGKSDPIDALAVARAALAHGIENLPTARLSGPSLEIRLIHQHHQRLIKQRTALINDLRWNLHDLWPEFKVPARRLRQPSWQQAASRKLQHARTSARVRVARDELRRVRELTHAINELVHELTELITDTAPQLLAETGIGPITAASLIGEIADAERFASDAQLARTAGCAPIPVSSGRTDRHRLDRGGNRQLNSTLHMIAITRMRLDPATALYIAKKRTAGRTNKEAIRCLKRHLIRRIWRLLRDPASARTALIC